MGFTSDGSYYCTWPYLAVTRGIVAEISFQPPRSDGFFSVSLTERGRFTEQHVKYSHHRSGFAQFSLTGRARNDVRRRSFRLDGPRGRLIIFRCNRPEAFKLLTRLKPKRLYLTAVLSDQPPEAFAIKGEWFPKEYIRRNLRGRETVGPLAPQTDLRTRRGGHSGLLVAPIGLPRCYSRARSCRLHPSRQRSKKSLASFSLEGLTSKRRLLVGPQLIRQVGSRRSTR
jgi:hypothetical protein